MEVKEHIILSLDILGYKSLIGSCKDSQAENYYLNRIHSIMSNLSDIHRKEDEIDMLNLYICI